MDQEKIGKFILQLRKEKGLTQKELAEKLEVTDRAVSKWENGRGMPDVALMKPLCEILGISVNELLGGERFPQEEYQEKSEFNFLNTIGYTEKKIKKNSLFLRLIAIFTAVALLTVLLLMDARVITRRNFSANSDLEFFSVTKRLPVAEEGQVISMDTVDDFVDQDITEDIDLEELESLLPLMRVSMFPIFLNRYWAGDKTYEIFGYVHSGPQKGKVFNIVLGFGDVNYLQDHDNRRYYIKDSESWIKIMELLEGWEGGSRELFQWEGQTLQIYYEGKLYSGAAYLRELPNDAENIGTISGVSQNPDEERECSFSHQGNQLYRWLAGGTEYIGVQVSYDKAYCIPMK